MKQEISSLELGYLIRELEFLINAKIDKIYQNKEEFLFQLHVPNKGKQMLKLVLPSMMYLTSQKSSYGEPKGFCMFLRKYLQGSRLREMTQKESERIIEFKFESNKGESHLMIELFPPGNVIFCKEGKVVSAHTYHKWKSRTIRPGIKYEYPKREYNFFEMNETKLKEMLDKTEKENLVKSLAMDLGLGGVYAEEVCIIARVNKEKKKLSNEEISSICKALKKILNKKSVGVQYLKEENIIDYTPFELNYYENYKSKKFDSFNEVLDATFSPLFEHKEENKVKKEKEDKIKKIEKIIKRQKETMKTLEEGIKENTAKAEIIYQKYQEIEKIITGLKEAREKYSWKEIQEQLKDNKKVKKINAKENKILIDL